MSGLWLFGSCVIAILSGSELISWGVIWWRAREYPPNSLFGEFHLRTPIEASARNAHDKAIRIQSAYVRSVARCLSALGLAFVVLAATSTIFRSYAQLDLIEAYTDGGAFILALFYFLRARHLASKWIGARVKAEMLRQEAVLEGVWGVALPMLEPNIKEGGSTSELIEMVQSVWKTRSAAVLNCAPTMFQPDRLTAYLNGRVVRQKRWFEDARSRITHGEHFRQRLFGGLFLIAAAIAGLRLTLPRSAEGELYSLGLLVLTGTAGFVGAFTLSRGNRSLLHRYGSQLKMVKSWMSQFTLVGDDNALKFCVPQGEIAFAIVQFEGLMINELIDWIEITSHDTIELSP